jgi:hypothetical protein
MRSGIAYQLPPLVPLTDATASGLWPAPVIPNGGRSVAHATITGRTAMHNGKKVQIDPNQAVKMWPTPTRSMSKDCGPVGSKAWQHNYDRGRLDATAKAHGTSNGGSLNPAWVEFLMGLPTEWTALEHSATPSSRKSRKSSDAQS